MSDEYTVNDFIEDMEIEEPIVFFEPRELFDLGIIGLTEDKCHVIYGYNKLTYAIAEKNQKIEKAKGEDLGKTFDDYLLEACDCVDYETIRSINYMPKDFMPIIMLEYEARKSVIEGVDA